MVLLIISKAACARVFRFLPRRIPDSVLVLLLLVLLLLGERVTNPECMGHQHLFSKRGLRSSLTSTSTPPIERVLPSNSTNGGFSNLPTFALPVAGDPCVVSSIE